MNHKISARVATGHFKLIYIPAPVVNYFQIYCQIFENINVPLKGIYTIGICQESITILREANGN